MDCQELSLTLKMTRVNVAVNVLPFHHSTFSDFAFSAGMSQALAAAAEPAARQMANSGGPFKPRNVS